VIDPEPVLIGTELWVQFETAEWAKMQERFAHLIAAAPDLYAALQLARVYVEAAVRVGNVPHKESAATALAAIRAALAKAEGRP
jgi:hypothetical protein